MLILVYATMREKEAINLRLRGHGGGERNHGMRWRRGTWEGPEKGK